MAGFVNLVGAFDFTTFTIGDKFNPENFSVSPTSISTNVNGTAISYGGDYTLDGNGDPVSGNNIRMSVITFGVPQYRFTDYSIPVGDLSRYINTNDTSGFLNAVLGGDDQLQGAGGNDHLTGLGGNDVLIGLAGNDILDGGAGFDTVNYLASPSAVSVDLRSGVGFDGFGGTDTITNVEIIVGSEQSDSLIGNAADNLIVGGDGDDLLGGGAGGDYTEGGGGNDLFDLGAGYDKAYGGGGDDRFVLESGEDVADGGAGNDIVDGGDGTDALYGSFDNDIMDGGNDDDFLYGGGGNDALAGGPTGNDVIDGGFGNDVLDGGNGENSLTGGVGLDIFQVAAHENTLDVINDFTPEADAIRLTGGAAIADVLASAQLTDGGSSLLVLGNNQYILVVGLQDPSEDWFVA